MSELNRHRTKLTKLGLQVFADELNSAIDDLRTKVGTGKPTFVDSVKPLAPTQPSPATFGVTGLSNVGFKIQIVNPQDINPQSPALARAKITKGPNAPLTPLFHNLQSAMDTSFSSSSGVVDYGISNQTAVSIPATGKTLYWRMRSSFDGQNWNAWQLLSGARGPIAVSV